MWRERPEEELISYLYGEIDGLLIGELYLRRFPTGTFLAWMRENRERARLCDFMNKTVEDDS